AVRRMLSATASARRRDVPLVTPATCGVRTTLSSFHNGLSASSGSTANTSKPAPRKDRRCSASTSAAWSTMPPRATLIRTLRGRATSQLACTGAESNERQRRALELVVHGSVERACPQVRLGSREVLGEVQHQEERVLGQRHAAERTGGIGQRQPAVEDVLHIH